MTDETYDSAWYNETVRRIISDDGYRVATRHSGGWDLGLVVADPGMIMGNPFGVYGPQADDEWFAEYEISEESAMAYIRDWTMPAEYGSKRRCPDDRTLLAKFRAAKGA